MTYAQLLLLFVAPPIFALSLLILWDHARKQSRERLALGWTPWAILGALVVVATLYTTPWDNHMIASRVWWYQPALISGISLGWIPLEELLFFPLQTLLIGLWFIWRAPHFMSLGNVPYPSSRSARTPSDNAYAYASASRGKGASGARLLAVVAGLALWSVALAVLRLKWLPGTYLGWELIWALPPMIIQIGLGGDILWKSWRVLLVALILPVVYLCAVDAYAIHTGIWTIDPHQSLDILIGGQLPVEELVFFTMTSALVTFGLVLGVSAESRQRLRSYRTLLGLSRQGRKRIEALDGEAG